MSYVRVELHETNLDEKIKILMARLSKTQSAAPCEECCVLVIESLTIAVSSMRMVNIH